MESIQDSEIMPVNGNDTPTQPEANGDENSMSTPSITGASYEVDKANQPAIISNPDNSEKLQQTESIPESTETQSTEKLPQLPRVSSINALLNSQPPSGIQTPIPIQSNHEVLNQFIDIALETKNGRIGLPSSSDHNPSEVKPSPYLPQTNTNLESNPGLTVSKSDSAPESAISENPKVADSDLETDNEIENNKPVKPSQSRDNDPDGTDDESPDSKVPVTSIPTPEIDPFVEAIARLSGEQTKRIRKPSVKRQNPYGFEPQYKKPKISVNNSKSSKAGGKETPTVKTESSRTTPTAALPSTKSKKLSHSKKRTDHIKQEEVGTPTNNILDALNRPEGPEEYSEGYASEDGDLYCICRRPDTGVWMIGCDICDDWFHGDCVNLTEKDSRRFVKYACPRCTAAKKGQSVYKRKCRLPGCINPVEENSDLEEEDDVNTSTASTGPQSAKKDKSYIPSKKSKYCSKEHAVQFFKLIVQEQLPKHKPINFTAITTQQLATLVRSCTNIDQFHKLGSTFPKYDVGKPNALKSKKPQKGKLLQRGTNASEAAIDIESIPTVDLSKIQSLLTTSDKFQLKLYQSNKSKILAQLKHLDLRRELLQMCKEYTKKISEKAAKEAGVKKKDLCGYDTRLCREESEWAEGELEEVVKGHKSQTKTTTPNPKSKTKTEENELESDDADDADDDSNDNDHPVCLSEKRKCGKHQMWQNIFAEETDIQEQGLSVRLEKVNAQLAELYHNVFTRSMKPLTNSYLTA